MRAPGFFGFRWANFLAAKRICKGRLVLWLSPLMLACVTACVFAPTALKRPNAVVSLKDGSLLVTDRGNNRVAKLSLDGRLLDSFGHLGTGTDEFFALWDLTLDSHGNFYVVTDSRNQNASQVVEDGVKVFSPEGKYLRSVGMMTYDKDDLPLRPYGVEIDNQDNIFISDYAANTVRIFNTKGQLIAKLFGKSGTGFSEFNGIQDVGYDDNRKLLYVVDSLNSRIQQFELKNDQGIYSTKFMRSIGGYGIDMGHLSYPTYMLVDDQSGLIYVGDMGNKRIQVFDSEGRSLRVFSPPLKTKTWQVMGLAFGEPGTLLAVDAFNNTIWRFATDGRFLGKIGSGK